MNFQKPSAWPFTPGFIFYYYTMILGLVSSIHFTSYLIRFPPADADSWLIILFRIVLKIQKIIPSVYIVYLGSTILWQHIEILPSNI